IGPDQNAGMEEAARREHRNRYESFVAVSHSHQQRRARHLRDIELAEVQFAPEHFRRMGCADHKIDAIGLHTSLPQRTRAIVVRETHTELDFGCLSLELRYR